jgi:hypothetical protein
MNSKMKVFGNGLSTTSNKSLSSTMTGLSSQMKQMYLGNTNLKMRHTAFQITGMGALPTTSPVTQGGGVTIYTMLKALL